MKILVGEDQTVTTWSLTKTKSAADEIGHLIEIREHTTAREVKAHEGKTPTDEARHHEEMKGREGIFIETIAEKNMGSAQRGGGNVKPRTLLPHIISLSIHEFDVSGIGSGS